VLLWEIFIVYTMKNRIYKTALRVPHHVGGDVLLETELLATLAVAAASRASE
jgi:hypothetical protein